MFRSVKKTFKFKVDKEEKIEKKSRKIKKSIEAGEYSESKYSLRKFLMALVGLIPVTIRISEARTSFCENVKNIR